MYIFLESNPESQGGYYSQYLDSIYALVHWKIGFQQKNWKDLFVDKALHQNNITAKTLLQFIFVGVIFDLTLDGVKQCCDPTLSIPSPQHSHCSFPDFQELEVSGSRLQYQKLSGTGGAGEEERIQQRRCWEIRSFEVLSEMVGKEKDIVKNEDCPVFLKMADNYGSSQWSKIHEITQC